LNILIRLILVPFGWFAALFAATSLIATVSWLRAYPPIAGDDVAVSITSLVVLADWFILFALIGQAALLPVLAAIAAAEILRLRSVFYFCAAGLVSAFAVSRLLDPQISGAIPSEPAIAGAAGLAGGLVYWLVAGRSSGILREPAPA
jgi:hypothetical protein